MKPFDLIEFLENPTRKICTRCGYHAQILEIRIMYDLEGKSNTITALINRSEDWFVVTYSLDGQLGKRRGQLDLMFPTLGYND